MSGKSPDAMKRQETKANAVIDGTGDTPTGHAQVAISIRIRQRQLSKRDRRDALALHIADFLKQHRLAIGKSEVAQLLDYLQDCSGDEIERADEMGVWWWRGNTEEFTSRKALESRLYRAKRKRKG